GPPSTRAFSDRRPPPPRQHRFSPRSSPSRSARVSDRYSQSLGNAHQVGKRRRRHLLHYVPSMYLQRDLADLELSGRLLIEMTAHHVRAHLAFPGGQIEVALSQCAELSALQSLFSILFDSGPNCSHKIRVAEGLG